MSDSKNKIHTHHAPKEDAMPAPDSLPLLGGGGLLKMLEHVLPLLNGAGKAGHGNPFDVVGDSDFDDEDDTVKHFKNDMDGCHGVVKIIRIGDPKEAIAKLSEMIETLKAVRQASRLHRLRQTFAAIHRVIKNVDGGQSQMEAARLLSKLAADANTPSEQDYLRKARAAVLAGTGRYLDAAAFRVRRIFASHLPKASDNTRLAWTTLETQGGEGYLLCPKAKEQVGHAIPMEQSKCRDHCIDARVARDGSVRCAYQEWLRTAADSQANYEARREVQRHPDNEANLLTLYNEGVHWNDGLSKADYTPDNKVRAHALTKNDRNWEQRLEEDTKHRAGDQSKNNDNMESKLNKSDLYSNDRDQKDRAQDLKPTNREATTGCCGDCSGKHCDGSCCQLHKGRLAGLNATKPGVRIDPSTEDTLGRQIEDGDKPWPKDKVIEELLSDKHKNLSEKEVDMLLERLLENHREEQG